MGVLDLGELVLLGALDDGCDNETAAQRLGRAIGTIGTARRNIYRKLGLRHKGELVEYAAQHGFVRFSRGGTVRSAFQPEHAVYIAKPGARAAPSWRCERRGRGGIAGFKISGRSPSSCRATGVAQRTPVGASPAASLSIAG